MGRERRRKDRALPHYVQRKPDRNRVVWREYLGKGRFGKVVTLLHEDGSPLASAASQRDIMAAYSRQVTASTGHTLGWLIDQYLKSPQFAARAASTRRAYAVHAETIKGHMAKNGRVFGDAPLRSLNPPIFSKYRDRRSESAPVAANRELQFIRAVFSWGIEYGHCHSNPAKGVRLNSESSRDRYVEDWELETVQACGSDMLAVAMELAYLLRARIGEVLALRRADMSDTGVYVRRTKGSNSEVTRWSDRLREAVRAAQALHRGTISPYLLHDREGAPITYPAVRSAFARALAKAQDRDMAEREGRAVLKKPFTLHDLKAKGITDHKHHHGGHRSARMREVYVRKAEEVDSTR